MSYTIFMCGHGGYEPNDGYFQLPKGCSLEFIVNHAKLLPTADMYSVCGGTYGGASDRTIGEFGTVPNMTWYPDEIFKIDICKKRLYTNKKVKNGAVVFPNDYTPQLNENKITLKKWFSNNNEIIRNTIATHGALLFVWNCCSALGLRPSLNGANFGVNAGQGETSYTFLNLTNGIIPTGRTVAR